MALTLILGNQLHRGWLQPSPLQLPAAGRVLMLEDLGLAGAYRFHRLRLLHTFVAMRAFAAALHRHRQDVVYGFLSESETRPFWQRLNDELRALPGPPRLRICELADQGLQRQLERFCREREVTLEVLPSPAFLESAAASRAWFEARRRPFMKTFYERQRRRLGLLLTAEGTPLGGRWSYDSENRRRLPRDYREPPLPAVATSPEEEAVRALISRWFPDNPGRLGPLPFPWDHAGADAWLEDFLQQRLEGFGPYEDALSSRHDTLHHSLLSPLLNIGLLDPGPLLEALLQQACRRGIAPLQGEAPLALPGAAGPAAAPAAVQGRAQSLPPLPIASLEGFLRQLIGWREFVRGIDLVHGERQQSSNFWDHQRRLAPCWQDGSTGLPPLDRAIERVNRLAYNHHIERLMVISCLMLLCEIAPQEAHRWFMERYIDSYEWVMGPNVYGMGLMSDGGIFATKPYICGSNYILKMGDDKRGPWCQIWDGLYWRFIDRHRSFFSGNPRLAMAVRSLERLDPQRRRSLDAAAAGFLERATLPPSG